MRRLLAAVPVAAALILNVPAFGAPPPPCDPGPKAVQEWKGYDARHPQFRKVSTIAIAPSGSVFLLDQELHVIREFSTDGRFLKNWELPDDSEALVAMAASDSFLYVSDGHVTYQLFGDGSIATWTRGAAPSGLAVDELGHVFISASTHRMLTLDAMRRHMTPKDVEEMEDSIAKELGIWKLTSRGDVLAYWQAPPWPITVARDGTLYAVEPKSGKSFLRLGGKTPEVKTCRMDLQQTMVYRAIAVSSEGHLFVNDRENVVETDAKGKVIRRWCDAEPGYEPLSAPGSLGIDSKGYLYVVDYFKSRVLKFDLGTN
ncbi:MAG TPA: hypothetical protein VE910_03330 [Dongiaceae bacterium]|nr:hypothetical protein [Dongiaceae bacterium]